MMSPKTKTRRAPSSESASWKEHLGNWRTFAAVGGASLAAATNADAGIVFSGPQNVTVSIPTYGSHSAVKTFSIGGYKEGIDVRRGSFHGIATGDVRLNNEGGHLGFAAQNSSTIAAKKYAAGNPIHAVIQFTNALAQSRFGSAVHGSFGPGVVTGFVGFQAPNGDLGWLQLQCPTRAVPDLRTRRR
jgi:hypothetical protein